MLAVVSCIYEDGVGYEKCAKKIVKQSIPCDFLLYTDNPNITNPDDAWKIMQTTHHIKYELENAVNDRQFKNSLTYNKHPYMVYKFYKFNFHLFPELQKYRYVVWVDGSCEVINPDFAKTIIRIMKNNNKFLIFRHEDRTMVKDEANIAGNDARWMDPNLFGRQQPLQRVDLQFQMYTQKGFDDKWMKDGTQLWNTCFFAFRTNNAKVHTFMKKMWVHTMMFSTMCQVTFSYLVWKTNFDVLTLPIDGVIEGKARNNNLFRFLGHGNCAT